MNFGNAIRTSRLSRKLTQAEVATLAGVSRQAIVLLESNRGRVSTLLAVQPHAPIRLSGLPAGKTYGDRIRTARGERPICQIAELAGVTASTVKAIELNGGTVTSLAKIGRIVSQNATVEAQIYKPRLWRTVHGRTNPNRPIEDYYATPAPIARLLLDHHNFAGSILEPCVGEARVIERVLHERGYHDVTCFDLIGEGDERRDFFDITEHYDVIVTNPPFKRHVAFIQHARKIARSKIALLLPLNYLTGKERHSEIWTNRDFPLARMLIMNRGVNFLIDDPFSETLKSSQLYCAWYIFEREHTGAPTMQWIDNHELIERRG